MAKSDNKIKNITPEAIPVAGVASLFISGGIYGGYMAKTASHK